MPIAEITKSETRARAALVSVDGYGIELDVSAEAPTFRSTTTIRFRSTTPGAGTYVDLIAEDSGVRSITLNGTSLDPATHYADGRISLPGLAASNTLTVVADLEYSTPGFHRSTDPVDGKVYTYTKFEPDHARRVFACFEQPDLKAPFAISVIAPASWTVISTRPAPRPAPLPGRAGLARWDFPPTPRLSTYLMHVTAGEYETVSASHTTPRGQVLPLRLACRASRASDMAEQAPDIFDLTRRGLDYFTSLFDMDFPFDKYDQQFVPHYPAGATEHPAAVTLEEDLLFRSRATDAEHEQRAVIILHEMAHMWFGDLVTMRWWDDLWLNESFAEWAGHQAAAAATRFTGAWTGFASSRKSWGYATDLAPGTHPIAADVASVSEAMANFDGISYAKGASVLKQLIAYLGEDAFTAGLRAHFAEHAWGTATLADFLRHLGAASGRDLTAWSEAWLRTSRPNTLAARFEVDGAGRFTSFAVVQEEQEEHPAPRPHHIAIGLYRRSGGRLTRVHRIEADVDGPLTRVPALVGLERPDLVLVNDDDLGYALIRLDERSRWTLTEAIGEFEDELPRAVCLTSARLLAEQGRMPVPEFVGLAAAALAAATSVSAVQAVRQAVQQLLLFQADPAWTPRGREVLAATAERMLRAAEPGGDLQLAWAQLLTDHAVTDGQLGLVRGLYQGTISLPGLEPDQELRWRLLARLAATGAAGDAEIDAEAGRDPSDRGRRAALAARAGIRDAAHKQAAWDYLTGAAEPALQAVFEIGWAFRETDDPALLAPFRDRFFAGLLDVWDRRKGFMKQLTVQVLFPTAVVDAELFALVDAFLDRYDGTDPALVRAVREGRDLARRAAYSRP